MRTITSSTGKVETVIVRRTESSDAQQISKLFSPASVAVFGRVNVIYILEKANLAVTLSTAKNQVLAHAAFLDHPIGDLVDQTSWQQLLQTYFNGTKFTPLNTLFLHLFVAQSSFSTASAKEIIRTVFNAITELEYICLVTPYSSCLESALLGILEPMPCVKQGAQCAAFVCHRHKHCPRLHVRRARVEDHDDLTQVSADRSRALDATYGPFFLAELIQAQDETNHVAVCENEGRAVGLISVSGDVDLKLLEQCFELGPFNGLRKDKPAGQAQRAGQPTPGQAPEEHPEPMSPSISQPQPEITKALESTDADGSKEGSEVNTAVSRAPGDMPEEVRLTGARIEEFTDSCTAPEPVEPPNAFCIQLFVIDKRFEMRSVDFLPYVFKVFPERDFCVISVPQLVPEFPLLQAFYRAVPRSSCSLHQELYILHRSGLLKTVEVRVAVSDDTAAVQRLVQKLNLHEVLLHDLDQFLKARRDPDGTPIQAFVAQVEQQVVGVIIIRNEEDIEYIRANYNIENFVYFSHHQREEHGQLCHFALNPIFQHYTKHFLKEVLRLAQKSCLYCPVYPAYHAQKNAHAHSLAAVLDCMVPVYPRRQVIYQLEELGTNAPSALITKKQIPYALNHMNRKLTMEPKLTVNARIVVVGASDTGLAFLEALVFCPHLRFNNLTIISPHGFPDCQSSDDMNFLATSHGYSEADLARLSLRSWVNSITGKMMAIDRSAKHVQVAEGRLVPYDHLILCTGQQYQMVCPTGVDISKSTLPSLIPDQPRRRYTGPVPSNLFTLNDQQDCIQAYHWLLKNFIQQEGNAVVYGDSIDVYTCVETLLCLGVKASRIHLVHQTAGKLQSCFPDATVQQVVRKALEVKEVHVHYSCLLAQMNDGQDPEPLTSVSFTTDGPPLRLECAVFFNFSYKGIDYDAFKAISDACLVFDGRLVIDTTFHTNDDSIRAAGPLTKFSRRYHAEQWTHAEFNSKEVGQELASVLLPFFDPALEPPANPPPDVDRLIPLYSQPKIQGGKLPGGYSYLHIQKPSLYTNLALAVAKAVTSPLPCALQGRKIETGHVETGDYFCLQFSQHGLVESVTCLSPERLPVSNYICLYGKHQLLLNHLYERFDEGLLSDLHSYFRERWCMAIYHDRFVDFEQEVRDIMEATNVEADGDSVTIAKLSEMIVDGTREIPREPSLYLSNIFEQSEGPARIKRTALDFLKYNRYHLTMYAQPTLL